MKILVAEDDANTRDALREVLDREGFRVVTASNGREALDLFRKEKPDFICLDVMMPELNGYEVCNRIRREDESVPVLFLTAKSEEIEKVLGLELGADDYMTGTTVIAELSGLMNPIRGLPFTMGLMLLALMAAAGIPGLAGFPAELLVFEGSWTVFPRATLICLVASGFTAVYAVRLFNRVGFGRLDNNRADWQSTRLAERLPAVVLTTLVVLAGIWPVGLTAWSEASTAAIALRHSDPVVQTLALAPPSPSSTLPA